MRVCVRARQWRTARLAGALCVSYDDDDGAAAARGSESETMYRASDRRSEMAGDWFARTTGTTKRIAGFTRGGTDGRPLRGVRAYALARACAAARV